MAKPRRTTSRPAVAKKKTSGGARKAKPVVHKAVRALKKARASVKAVVRKAVAANTVLARPASRRPASAKAKPAPARGPRLVKQVAPPAPPRRSTYAEAVATYERAMQALQAKKYRDAAEILKKVIDTYPEEKELHERALLYLRVCDRQMRPPDAAARTPEEQVYAATLAINVGAVDRAIALLSTALQRSRDDDRAEYLLGVALAMRGDVAGAAPHIERAAQLNPENRDVIRKEPDLEAVRQVESIRALLAAPPPPAVQKDKARRPAPRGKR